MDPVLGATLYQGGLWRKDGRYTLLVFGLGGERWTHDVARGSEIFPEDFYILIFLCCWWWQVGSGGFISSGEYGQGGAQ